MKNRLIPLAVLVAGVAAACGGGSGSNAAATVNGHPIPSTRVTEVTKQFVKSPAFKSQAQQSSASATKQQFERTLLSTYIKEQVLAPEASKRNISVSSKEVDARIAQIKSQQFKTESQFKQALGQQGLTLSLLQELIKDQLLEMKLHDQVAPAKDPTASQVRDYYNQNRMTQFTKERASHILVKSKTLAARLSKELQKTPKSKLKEKFSALAKRYSTDSGSKDKGGDLGYFSPSQLVPEFSAAAAQLKVGEVSDPVQSQYGYHVIWLTGRKTAPFAKVKDQIVQTIKSQLPDTKWQKFLHDLYVKANITVKKTYGKFDITQMQVVSPTASPSATPISSPTG